MYISANHGSVEKVNLTAEKYAHILLKLSSYLALSNVETPSWTVVSSLAASVPNYQDTTSHSWSWHDCQYCTCIIKCNMTCNVKILIWYILNVPIEHICGLEKLKLQTFVLATGLSKTVKSTSFKHAHKHNGLVIQNDSKWQTTQYLFFIWKVVFLWSYRRQIATTEIP